MAQWLYLVLVSWLQCASGASVHRQRHRPDHPLPAHFSLPPMPHYPTNNPASNACEFNLPIGCNCTKSNPLVTYSITCAATNLTHIPKIDIGPKLIKTLNLEENRLSTIQMGDFYGLKIERLLLPNNSLQSLPLLAFWGLEFHLSTLDLSYNYLSRVPSDALRLLRNLRTLSLTANRISALYHYDFGYLQRLEILTLDKNPISLISTAAFLGTRLDLVSLNSINLRDGLDTISTSSFSQLKGLSLASNSINHIPTDWFASLNALAFINLEKNELNQLDREIFSGSEYSLHNVILNENVFAEIPSEAIRKLRVLRKLGLSGNQLERIHANSFNESHLLEKLDLSRNSIRQLNSFAFRGLDAIDMIDLRHNELFLLDVHTFYWSPPGERKIYLSDNPWLCNCVMKWMKKEDKKSTDLSRIFIDSSDMMCSRPSQYRNTPLIRLTLKDFTCNHSYYDYHETTERDEVNGDWIVEENQEEDYDVYDHDYPYTYYDNYDTPSPTEGNSDKSETINQGDNIHDELDQFDIDTWRQEGSTDSVSGNANEDDDLSGSGHEFYDDDSDYMDYSDDKDGHNF